MTVGQTAHELGQGPQFFGLHFAASENDPKLARASRTTGPQPEKAAKASGQEKTGPGPCWIGFAFLSWAQRVDRDPFFVFFNRLSILGPIVVWHFCHVIPI